MQKTILVLGGDGYYGWPLAMKIAIQRPDEKIIIMDNEWRRHALKSFGFQTLIPIAKPQERINAFQEIHGQDNLHYIKADINSPRLEQVIETEKPHTIFHFAQQCSAPYSMKGMEEALFTIKNNESGNMRLLWAVRRHVPGAHVIKLGSFGEYAQGGIDIAEGYFMPEHKGMVATKPMPFPREADDIYHISKINDTNYVAMACRVWNLRITDVMQSTIFGFITEEMAGCPTLYTRCDYDHIFGTVLNRFLTQVVSGHPMTIYGTGHQRTGLMALRDSVNSLSLLVNDPPAAGVHKVINHVTETEFSINELAATVKDLATEAGYQPEIIRTHDPRVEQPEEKAEYGIDTDLTGHATLHSPFTDIVAEMLHHISTYKGNIQKKLFIPKVKWDVDIVSGMKKQGPLEDTDVKDESFWDLFRERNFASDRINLNPGTLGTTSLCVKQSRNNPNPVKDPEGFPLGSYESGRKSLEEISKLCDELWPAKGYNLSVTHSTSQTMNLLALAMLRKFQNNSKGPYKIFTSTHEHEGGIGCFHYLPEYEIYYIPDNILADPEAMRSSLSEIRPHLAFFSHVYYDTGNVSPIAQWTKAVKETVPGCKIVLDVAQSLGLYEIPFGDADVVLGSTHKWLFGPHGGGLMWMKVAFQQWIEAIYWSGHGLTHNPDIAGISIPGGQDFRLYPAIAECLKFYKLSGRETILGRCSHLSRYFQGKIDEIFGAAGISYEFLNHERCSPIVAVAFRDYNPYPLYKYLNEQSVHIKCIMDHDIMGTKYNILRIGIPYFETMERLHYALFEIGRFIHKNVPVEKLA